jgi:hypothetical protein
MLAIAFAGSVLLIVFLLVPQWLPFKAAGSGPNSQASQATKSDAATQAAGESAVAKKDPTGEEDATGGRARQIQASSRPLSLSEEQRLKIRNIVAGRDADRKDQTEFQLQIGAAVPRQTELRDLPPEVSQAMDGYWGGQYVLVRDTMVIVDRNSRRIAAIVPGI